MEPEPAPAQQAVYNINETEYDQSSMRDNFSSIYSWGGSVRNQTIYSQEG